MFGSQNQTGWILKVLQVDNQKDDIMLFKDSKKRNKIPYFYYIVSQERKYYNKY